MADRIAAEVFANRFKKLAPKGRKAHNKALALWAEMDRYDFAPYQMVEYLPSEAPLKRLGIDWRELDEIGHDNAGGHLSATERASIKKEIDARYAQEEAAYAKKVAKAKAEQERATIGYRAGRAARGAYARVRCLGKKDRELQACLDRFMKRKRKK